MEKQNPPIEELPFFEGFHGTGKAIVDVKKFEQWLEEAQAVEMMSPEDERDREKAYDELKKGKALNLKEAMKEW